MFYPPGGNAQSLQSFERTKKSLHAKIDLFQLIINNCWEILSYRAVPLVMHVVIADMKFDR